MRAPYCFNTECFVTHRLPHTMPPRARKEGSKGGKATGVVARSTQQPRAARSNRCRDAAARSPLISSCPSLVTRTRSVTARCVDGEGCCVCVRALPEPCSVSGHALAALHLTSPRAGDEEPGAELRRAATSLGATGGEAAGHGACSKLLWVMVIIRADCCRCIRARCGRFGRLSCANERRDSNRRHEPSLSMSIEQAAPGCSAAVACCAMPPPRAACILSIGFQVQD